MSEIKVDYEQARATARLLNIEKDNLNKIATSLAGNKNDDLLSWRGESAAMFNTLLDKWASEAKDIGRCIEEVATKITKVANTLEETEKAIIANITNC